MGYLEGQRQINNLITFSNSGVDIATFAQIRDAITNRYKEVYGKDIDLTLSPTNADGVFVNDLALIINNILQSIHTLYANLDVNIASGVYLDNLCRLSNIIRKEATQSNAYINVKNIGETGSGSIIIYPEGNTNETVFIDVSGAEWIYKGQPISIEPSQTVSIQVFARETGSIVAPKNSIYQAAYVQNLVVTQPNDANIGNEPETDSELRARRAQSVGATGSTVLEALISALLSLSAIQDVKIHNNNTNSDKPALDGTKIGPHSVYIILRQIDGIDIDNSVIGQTIYNKLTPGISTNKTTDSTTGESMEYSVEAKSTYLTVANETMYWKKAKPITTAAITVSMTKSSNYASSTDDLIKQKVVNYINNLRIGEVPTASDIMFTAMTADPTFNGMATYVVTGVTGVPETNTDTYFNIQTSNVTIS